MLALDLPTEPHWIELGHGVRVRIKPATTAIVTAAKSAAAREMLAAREELGGDADLLRGLAFATFIRVLARHLILEWDGVADQHGEPLELTPAALERLFDIEEMASSFADRALQPLRHVEAEGKG